MTIFHFRTLSHSTTQLQPGSSHYFFFCHNRSSVSSITVKPRSFNSSIFMVISYSIGLITSSVHAQPLPQTGHLGIQQNLAPHSGQRVVSSPGSSSPQTSQTRFPLSSPI